MKKLILFLLTAILLILPLSGCFADNKQNEETTPGNTTENTTPDATTQDNLPEETTLDATTPPENNQDNPPVVEGELDKNSELIVTLVDYLNEYWEDCDLPEKTLAGKINDIKSGTKPLHVTFNPDNYYYVCGYYNGSHENEDFDWCCPEEYTWKRYDTEIKIQEYYNGTKCVVVFQMNKALTVTNILSNEAKVPNMEHFQIFTPVFESGANTATAIAFECEFIFLNDEDKDTVYHCKQKYNHELVTMDSIYLDDEYYILQFLEGVLPGEEFNVHEFLGNESIIYEFGDYYDAIISVMDTEKYRITKENGKIIYYGVVSIEDFVNNIIK